MIVEVETSDGPAGNIALSALQNATDRRACRITRHFLPDLPADFVRFSNSRAKTPRRKEQTG